MKSIIISLLICLCCFPMHLSSQDLTIEEQWERELEAEKAKQKKEWQEHVRAKYDEYFANFILQKKLAKGMTQAMVAEIYPDAPYEFTSRVYTSERITIWRFVGHIEALGAYRGDGEFIPFSEYPKELHFKDDKLAEVIWEWE